MELQYNDFIARFDPVDGTLREITLLPNAKAIIDGLQVTWNWDFLHGLHKLDAAPWDVFGFIVFAKLGIAVTGIHDNDESQLAITLFSTIDLDEFIRGGTPFSALNEE